MAKEFRLSRKTKITIKNAPLFALFNNFCSTHTKKSRQTIRIQAQIIMKRKILASCHSFKNSLIPIIAAFILSSTAACAQSGWRKADELFEAMELKEGSWVADIGSREGYYTVRMAPIVGESGHVFAVDIEADALEDLHENLREDNIENVTPVYSVYDNPMLPVNSLDAVLIRNAYHEFTEHMAMLNHIKQALKPGGRLVMAEPISEDNLDESREHQADSHDIAIRYARQDLLDAGFEIIKEVDPFSETRRNQHYWMIITVRPDNI